MESILVVVSDLMFRSKIREAARGSATSVEMVSRAEAALDVARRGAPARIVVDLADTKFDAVELVRGLKAAADVPVVGYYPHVRVDLRDAAVEAGCDVVLPRSAFTARLADVLEGTFPESARRKVP